jgi:hypothetical protein
MVNLLMSRSRNLKCKSQPLTMWAASCRCLPKPLRLPELPCTDEKCGCVTLCVPRNSRYLHPFRLDLPSAVGPRKSRASRSEVAGKPLRSRGQAATPFHRPQEGARPQYPATMALPISHQHLTEDKGSGRFAETAAPDGSASRPYPCPLPDGSRPRRLLTHSRPPTVPRVGHPVVGWLTPAATCQTITLQSAELPCALHCSEPKAGMPTSR